MPGPALFRGVEDRYGRDFFLGCCFFATIYVTTRDVGIGAGSQLQGELTVVGEV